MIYICVAFKEEAKPLLQQWQFKRDRNAPCKLYIAEDICLLITQMGQKSAVQNVTAILHYLKPQANDRFINFGICAAPLRYDIGEALLCTELFYKEKQIALEPKSTCKTASLRTVDAAAASPCDTAVDMEAFGLFEKALEYFTPQTCYCIKVVSDHFEPELVKKESIASLLGEGVTMIKEIVNENRYCHRS